MEKTDPDGKKKRKNPNGPQPDDECRTCKEKGHWYLLFNIRANECHKKSRSRRVDRHRRRSPSESSSSRSRSRGRRDRDRRQRRRDRTPSSSSRGSSRSSSRSDRRNRRRYASHHPERTLEVKRTTGGGRITTDHQEVLLVDIESPSSSGSRRSRNERE